MSPQNELLRVLDVAACLIESFELRKKVIQRRLSEKAFYSIPLRVNENFDLT